MDIISSLGCAQPISSLTHLGGALFFAIWAYQILRLEKIFSLRFMSFAVFSGACVFLLVTSGVYHWASHKSPAHDILQRLDHAGIFLVIAGSFTPIHCHLFTGFLRWGILGLVWGLSTVGLILKLIYFTDIPEWVGLTYYLGLGWIGAITGFNLWKQHDLRFIAPLLLGGIFYTLGGLIEYQNTLVLIPGILEPHEMLHLGVLLGIGFQWSFIVKAIGFAQQHPLTPSKL